MMYLRLFISLVLASLPPILVLADIHTVQAQTRRPPPCCNFYDPICRFHWPKVGLCSPPPVFSPGGTTGGTWVPPAELLAQSRARIAQRNATVDDYLLDALANAIERNFTAAQTRYSQALELAVKNNDFERQAIARSSMGEIYAATGNLKEAASQLTLATGIYQRLGNAQRVSELNQRLVEINKPLQIDQPRIQIDQPRIQIERPQIEIQKR
jgi:hypothetical protein